MVLRGARADYSDLYWSVSGRGWGNMLGEWSWGHALALIWNDRYSTVLWARVPMLLLTLILGVFITVREGGFLGRPAAAFGNAENWEKVLSWLDDYLTEGA